MAIFSTAGVVLLSVHDRIIAGVVFAISVTAIIVLLHLLVKARKRIAAQDEERLRLTDSFSLRDAFINASDDLIYLKDETLRYVIVNDALAKHIDMAPHDLIGVDDFAITDTARADWRRETDLEVLEGKRRVHRIVRFDGEVYTINKFPVSLPDGTTGVGAIIRDITEEERLRAENIKIEKRQKRLLDVIQQTEKEGKVPYQLVLESALDLTDSTGGFILLAQGNRYAHVASKGCDKTSECKTVFEAMLEDEPIKRLLLDKKQVVFDNRPDLSHAAMPITRFLAMPLLVSERVYAVVVLINKPNDYTRADQRQLTLLIRGAGGTIERERMLAMFARQRAYAFKTFDNVRDGIVSIRADRTLGYLNQTAESLLNVSSKDVLGKPWQTHIRVEDASTIEGFLKDPTPEWSLKTTLNFEKKTVPCTAHSVHNSDDDFVGITLIINA